MAKPITVTTTVRAPMNRIWEVWNDAKHIMKWAFASDDWETPSAENDLRPGGKFKIRMQSKDGKEGFDFEGIYDAVKERELIEYTMSDGRHVRVSFEETPEGARITETFDPETENPEEVQSAGWQTILDNFKKYVEKNKK